MEVLDGQAKEVWAGCRSALGARRGITQSKESERQIKAMVHQLLSIIINKADPQLVGANQGSEVGDMHPCISFQLRLGCEAS